MMRMLKTGTVLLSIVMVVGCGTTSSACTDGVRDQEKGQRSFKNSLGMTMVGVQGGACTLGHADIELFQPRETVLANLYYIAMTEVTNAQYSEFDPFYTRTYPADLSTLAQPDAPVCGVSWFQADAFCNWLSLKEGKKYRLPTADEWEYCALAGRTVRYAWGDSWPPTPSQANLHFKDTLDEYVDADGYDETSPVTAFPPNPWGLYGMEGNVSEWCQDAWKTWARDQVNVNHKDYQWVRETMVSGHRVQCGLGWNWTISEKEPASDIKLNSYCSYRRPVDAQTGLHRWAGFRVVMEP